MSYRIEIRRPAIRELKALPGYVRAQARKMIRALGVEPRPLRAQELRGKPDIYRIWLAGRWRIAYEIDDESQRILVLRIRLKEDIDYASLSSEIHQPVAAYGSERQSQR